LPLKPSLIAKQDQVILTQGTHGHLAARAMLAGFQAHGAAVFMPLAAAG